MTVTMSISYAKGTDTWNKEVVSVQHDVAAVPRAGGTQTATGSAVALAVGGITTSVGFGYFRNLDASLSIDIGYDASGFKSMTTLLPGMVAWLHFKATVFPQIQRTTSGSPILEYQLFSL